MEEELYANEYTVENLKEIIEEAENEQKEKDVKNQKGIKKVICTKIIDKTIKDLIEYQESLIKIASYLKSENPVACMKEFRAYKKDIRKYLACIRKILIDREIEKLLKIY